MNEQRGKDQALEEMAEWLSHPLEYGAKPIEQQVIYEGKIRWFGEESPVVTFLIHYKMPNGTEGIGFTGPITWTFLSLNWEGFTPEDLIYCYVGWYAHAGLSHLNTYTQGVSDKARQRIFDKLHQDKLVDLVEEDAFTLRADEEVATFFAVRGRRDGTTYHAVGAEDGYDLYPVDIPPMRLPPFFYYLGRRPESDPFSRNT